MSASTCSFLLLLVRQVLLLLAALPQSLLLAWLWV